MTSTVKKNQGPGLKSSGGTAAVISKMMAHKGLPYLDNPGAETWMKWRHSPWEDETFKQKEQQMLSSKMDILLEYSWKYKEISMARVDQAKRRRDKVQEVLGPGS